MVCYTYKYRCGFIRYFLYIKCKTTAFKRALEEERRFMQKDITKKRLEDFNDVFADVFNALLFEGEEVLSEEFLEPLPTEAFTRKQDGGLRQGNRDVCKADKRNGFYRLICGQENQEGIDNTMPQRIMGYDSASYEGQVRQLISENTKAGSST